MATYDLTEIEQLVDGKLPWTRVQEIMKDPKDNDRFDKWLAVLQGRVSWPERILMPLTPHLFVVEKGRERIVKCTCGQEFGDWRTNWKLSALIYVRDSEEKLAEISRGWEVSDPAWVQMREYYCPGCGRQLEVETVPRGCPIDFEFLPDLDAFYRDWLGRPLADSKEFSDKTPEVIRTWTT